MPRFISVAAKRGSLGNPLLPDATGFIHRAQTCGKRSKIRNDRSAPTASRRSRRGG